MHTLDLRELYCPLNMVKTRLALEKMCSGEEIELYFNDEGSRENVTKNLLQERHNITSVTHENDYVRIVVVKN